MNKYFLPAVFIFLTSILFANAQSKTERYVQVTVKNKGGFTAKRIALIDFGDSRTFFALKDTSLFKKLKAVNNLTTETDVLNYMSMLGWELADIHSGGLYTKNEVMYFKKQFDSSDFVE